ncbi:chemotaxis protein CheA [Aquabacterium sp.]|uniref:chemotaxis protein CheA n=1 Tax=Aquabacterium sp. TaxID=1872578 RepID=UPI0025BD2ACF|nr:chemotaxis protein CheA [Aquabacterium sp.]
MSLSPDDLDQDFIREAMPAFISEAREQIENVEQLLLQLEDNPGDNDLLNALFRCAHTVKGSAGVFGLDAVVAFTHHVEGLLDNMREGEVALTPELSTLLLQCNDQIRILVDAADKPDADISDSEAERTALVARLQAVSVPIDQGLGGGHGGRAPAAVSASAPAPAAAALAHHNRWHVSVQFGDDIFRHGMDPWAILAYLQGLGQVESIVHDDSAVPPLEQLDPESCHMAFEFGLISEVGREAIESAFAFVREDCVLHVLGPDAQPAMYEDLIRSQPQRTRLGEILLEMGVITPHQLHAGLSIQAEQKAQDLPVQPLGDILEAELGVPARVVDAGLKKQKQREGATAPEDGRFIRVQADRLDAVINLLGELVVAGAGASLMARETRHSSLIEANAHMGRLIEEIRNGTLQLRMVPIGETFSRFRRVVRDTAADLGKEVTLEIVGGETELDKSMVERIADPLMHLVRNALDHGLETPAEREAEGKGAQGHLTLSACHESGSVLIRIRDDGRGVNREKVLARAWERGLVEKGVTPPDNEIRKLIFEPGFSTAEKITNLSGRGVGMDVVRKNIEALRGTVQISSPPIGGGTQIEIRLPLTLAIIDGFLVGVGDSKFIFPLEAVVEVIDGGGQARLMESEGRCCMELRGQVLPVMNMHEVYGLEPAVQARTSVVVIQGGGQLFGVLVDNLLGHHQTVIKPLSRIFRALRGILHPRQWRGGADL